MFFVSPGSAEALAGWVDCYDCQKLSESVNVYLRHRKPDVCHL